MGWIKHAIVIAAAGAVGCAAAADACEKATRIGFAGFMLGASVSGKWVGADQIQEEEAYRDCRIFGGEQAGVFLERGRVAEGVMCAPERDHPGEGGARQSDPFPGLVAFATQLEPGAKVDPGLEFASIQESGWNPRPREVEVLSPKSQAYRNALKKVLDGLGLSRAEPRIMQIVRADLDGDGVKEVIMSAQNIIADSYPWLPDRTLSGGNLEMPSSCPAQSYSLILVRKVVGGAVKDIIVDSYVSLKGTSPEADDWRQPIIHRIHPVLDLNGDGRMEILTSKVHCRGFEYAAWELGRNAAFTKVLLAAPND